MLNSLRKCVDAGVKSAERDDQRRRMRSARSRRAGSGPAPACAGAARPPRAACRPDRGAGDVLLGDLVARRACAPLAAGEDEHAVAQALQLDGVGREDDDACPLGGAAQDPVELDARAGVDAAGRLVGEKHRRLPSSERAKSTFCWLPPERVETGVSMRRACASQRLDLAGHALGLAPARDEARGATRVEHEERDVLADRSGRTALGVAVAGQVHDAAALGAAGVAERHALAGHVAVPARAQIRRARAGTRAGRCPRRPRGRRSRRAGRRGRRRGSAARRARARSGAARRRRASSALGGKALIDGAPDDQLEDLVPRRRSPRPNVPRGSPSRRTVMRSAMR